MSKPFPQRILIIRTDRIGDVLMSLPLVHCLKENFPSCRITMAVDEKLLPLFGCHPLINALTAVDTSKIKNRDYRKHLVRTLKHEAFDTVIIPAPDKFYHYLSFQIGAKLRIGFNRKWGIWLNHKISDRKSLGARHEFDCNLDLLKGICERSYSGVIYLGFDKHSRRQEILRKFGVAHDKKVIAVHATTSNAAKAWPLKNFKAVIERILQDKNNRVLLVGSEQVEELKREIPAVSEQVIDALGKTSLDELGVLLSRADCLVSLDSGPYHMAWMQGTPVVGIFIKEAAGSNPTRWGVYRDSAKNRQFYDSSDKITPEMVVLAIEDVLAVTL